MQVGGDVSMGSRRAGMDIWARRVVLAMSGWLIVRREAPPTVGSRDHHHDLASAPQSEPGGRPERDGARVAGQPLDSSFDAFYTRHEQPLYGYLRRLSPTHEVAVELAQETFFRAWRHFDALRAYDRPEAWLYRVATNLAISHLRRKRPLSFSVLFGRTTATSATDSTPDGPTGADVIASPVDIEGQTIERDAIERALRALPERPRAALLLIAIHGFTSEEVAEALGVTPNNARQILSRARQQFRTLYDQAQRTQP